MQDVIFSIIELLENERNVYDAFLRLAKKKKDVVIENNLHELDEIVKAEHVLVVQLGALERSRVKNMEDVARAIGKHVDEINMAELYELANNEQKSKLNEIREDITRTVEEQLKYHTINKQLITKNLEYVNHMLSVITDDDSAGVYKIDGTAVTSSRQILLDEKV